MDPKITKIDIQGFLNDQEKFPAFFLTVDTGISSATDFNEASKMVAHDLPENQFKYLPAGISARDAIIAANTYNAEDEVPKENTYTYNENPAVCEAANFILAHEDDFLVAGIQGISAPPGATTWYAAIWAVNKNRAKEWKI